MRFELKRLSPDAVPKALEKAERYRLLNEPGEAQSICLDALEVDPDNQRALVTLLLALTDQFDLDAPTMVGDAYEVVDRIADEYERAYYTGIVFERRAKARLRKGAPGCGPRVYEWLRDAMTFYEKAATLRPAGNDDAILRWNACARLIMRVPYVAPAIEEPAEPQFLE